MNLKNLDIIKLLLGG